MRRRRGLQLWHTAAAPACAWSRSSSRAAHPPRSSGSHRAPPPRASPCWCRCCRARKRRWRMGGAGAEPSSGALGRRAAVRIPSCRAWSCPWPRPGLTGRPCPPQARAAGWLWRGPGWLPGRCPGRPQQGQAGRSCRQRQHGGEGWSKWSEREPWRHPRLPAPRLPTWEGCLLLTWAPAAAVLIEPCNTLCVAMLAARALGRAAGLGARCSASLAARGASAALTDSLGSSKGRWSEYSRALARLGQGGPLGAWRDDDEPSKAASSKGLHTGGRGRAAAGAPRQPPPSSAAQASRALTRARAHWRAAALSPAFQRPSTASWCAGFALAQQGSTINDPDATASEPAPLAACRTVLPILPATVLALFPFAHH